MSEPHARPDERAMTVVPARPGPLVPLQDLDRRRDDVDDLLDELFGAPDDRGPGVADGVLFVGGAVAVVIGVAASWPAIVVVAGVSAVALGAVLPLRALWRRVSARRRSVRLRSSIGDGTLLCTDHPAIARLLDAHRASTSAGVVLAPSARSHVDDVAHAAVREVASLLGGRSPTLDEELRYVAARTAALEGLAQSIADPRTGDGDHDRRRAMIEARREIEHVAGGSSLTEAARLTQDLLGRDEA